MKTGKIARIDARQGVRSGYHPRRTAAYRTAKKTAARKAARKTTKLAAAAQRSQRFDAKRTLTLKERVLIWKKKQSVFHMGRVAALAVFLAGVLVIGAVADSSTLLADARVPEENPQTVFNDHPSAFSAAFVGDLALGRDIGTFADRHGYEALFTRTKSLWSGADYVFGNLECTLVDDESLYEEADKDEIFPASDAAAAALSQSGFTVLQLANNHTVDYGREGLLHTIDALSSAGIDSVGAGSNVNEAQTPVEQTYGALKVKTLAVSDIVADHSDAGKKSAGVLSFDTGDVFQAVSEAREDADIVVVGAHWGLEYTRTCTEDQRSLAHSLVDAGADIVIGTHAHTLEPIELYNGGIIFYGLGNFVSDDAWARARDSVIVRFDVAADGSSQFEVIPLRIQSGVPARTSDPVSMARDWAVLTKLLEDGSYMMEGSTMRIPFKTFDMTQEAVASAEDAAASADAEPAASSVPVASVEGSEEGGAVRG